MSSTNGSIRSSATPNAASSAASVILQSSCPPQSNSANNNNGNTSSDDGHSALSKRKRRKHKNSHNGCQTCKKRKVRCDETLPSCRNCKKMNFHCPYLDLSPSESERIRRQQVADEKARMVLLMSEYYSVNSAAARPGQTGHPQPQLYGAPVFHQHPPNSHPPAPPPPPVVPISYRDPFSQPIVRKRPPVGQPGPLYQGADSQNIHIPSSAYALHVSSQASLPAAAPPSLLPPPPTHHHTASFNHQSQHRPSLSLVPPPHPSSNLRPLAPTPHSQLLPVVQPSTQRSSAPLQYSNSFSESTAGLLAKPCPSSQDLASLGLSLSRSQPISRASVDLSGSYVTSDLYDFPSANKDAKSSKKSCKALPGSLPIAMTFEVIDYNQRENYKFYDKFVHESHMNFQDLLVENHQTEAHWTFRLGWYFSVVQQCDDKTDPTKKGSSRTPGKVICYILLHLATLVLFRKRKFETTAQRKMVDYYCKVFYGKALESLRVITCEKLTALGPEDSFETFNHSLKDIVNAVVLLPFTVLWEEENLITYVKSVKSGIGLFIELIEKTLQKDPKYVKKLTWARFLLASLNYRSSYKKIVPYDHRILHEFCKILAIFRKIAVNILGEKSASQETGLDSVKNNWFWEPFDFLSRFSQNLIKKAEKADMSQCQGKLYFHILKDWGSVAPYETLLTEQYLASESEKTIHNVLCLFYRAFSIIIESMFPKMKTYFGCSCDIYDFTGLSTWADPAKNQFDTHWVNHTEGSSNATIEFLSEAESRQFGPKVSLKDISVYLLRTSSFLEERLDTWIDIGLNIQVTSSCEPEPVVGISENQPINFYNRPISQKNYPHFKNEEDQKKFFTKNVFTCNRLEKFEADHNRKILRNLLCLQDDQKISSSRQSPKFDISTYDFYKLQSTQDFLLREQLYDFFATLDHCKKATNDYYVDYTNGNYKPIGKSDETLFKYIKEYEVLCGRKVSKSKRVCMSAFTMDDMRIRYEEKQNELRKLAKTYPSSSPSASPSNSFTSFHYS